MSKRNAVTVTQGQVLVNDCYLTQSTRNLITWELDCHSKYAEVGGYSGRDVMLFAGEYTLKANKEAGTLPTMVVLPRRVVSHFSLLTGKIKESRWQIMAEASRYTVRIVAWKPRRTRWWRRVWESEVDHYARMAAD